MTRQKQNTSVTQESKEQALYLRRSLRVTGYVQNRKRIILYKINTKPNNIGIIQTCRPTTNAEYDELGKVNEELNNLTDQTKAKDNFNVIVDINATAEEGKRVITVVQ